MTTSIKAKKKDKRTITVVVSELKNQNIDLQGKTKQNFTNTCFKKFTKTA